MGLDGSLTWDDWYSFQGSKNPEGSQCWDIAQVHKLCDISVREGREGGAIWKRSGAHAHTHEQVRHPHTSWQDKRRVMGGEGGGGNGKQSHTEDRWQERWEQAQAALPGITEIVFKALKTLNVRRAETLPRFTNSVIYLQDQMHSYYTAQAQTHTCAERWNCLLLKH